MDLLTFAHKGEAQTFINSNNLIANGGLGYLWEGSDYSLLITGEDKEYILKKLTAVIGLSKGKFSRIINFGICGALHNNLNLEEIYPVRTSLEVDSPSFTLNPSAPLDCISTQTHVQKTAHKEKLAQFAQLVDKELWSLASFAQSKSLPIESFKLVSDYSDENSKCVDIRSKAAIYSTKLHEYYCSMNNTVLKK